MFDGFVLKKLVSVFLHVIPGALILLLFLLIGRRWWPRVCNFLAIAVCCALIAGSTGPLSSYFVAELENRFPVLQIAPEDTALILVLGSGHLYKADRSVNSVLTATALSRLTEGVRLWRTRPEAYLALSGASFQSSVSHASVLREMALEMGVPSNRILVFDTTKDTEDEIVEAVQAIRSIKSQTGAVHDRIVITSSATHLPRAAMLLDAHGALYSMAPTDFLAVDTPWYRPNAGNLYSLDRAVHEWVGMAWYRMRGMAY